jgi:hypothetical protein
MAVLPHVKIFPARLIRLQTKNAGVFPMANTGFVINIPRGRTRKHSLRRGMLFW